ncbi:MAG TPA: hypothetical protein DD412_05155 [Holosporales bacterium]|nr:hypothetical protein [Holosporales bacterium]
MKNILTLTCASVVALGCATDLSAAAPTTKQGDAGLKAQVEMLMKRVNELEAKEKAVGSLTEKEAVTSGNNLNLTLSGQVNRAVLWHDDGEHSNFVHVDPSSDASTRFRIEATGKISEGNIAGGVIEMGVRSNAAEKVDVHYANDSSVNPKIRLAEAYFDSKRWGKVTLGQGYTAAALVTRYTDLSNTSAISSGTNVGQLAGGTIFVDKTKASTDPAFGSKAANKAKTSGGAYIKIAEIFNDIGNGGATGRENRIQYDTPKFWGTKLATSHAYKGRNDMWDVMLKHASTVMGTKIAVQAAYVHDLANTSNVTSSVVAPAKYTQWNGSIGALFPIGLSLQFAATSRNWKVQNAPDGKIYYGKVGYQQNFFEAGKTALALDYGHFENMFLNLGPNNAYVKKDYIGKTYGAGLVQHIDRVATEIYLSARVYALDGDSTDNARYKDITMVMSGLRVKF